MATKKTALASVTKKPVDADAWVNATPKTEITPPTATASEKAGAKPSRLVVELPPELHRKLKGKCGSEGLKIKDVIHELLQGWVNA
jgi:hypothetical protein